MSKYQVDRPDAMKPSVVKEYSAWWARCWTPEDKLLKTLHKSQPEALSKAYEYAQIVKAQS